MIAKIFLLFSLILFVESKIDTPFKSIFAFGDSYSDNGSFEAFYKGGMHRIDDSSLHSATSGTIKRSSDGPLWIEYLTQMMGNIDLYDFARSGSTANNKLIFRGTQDMDTQVKAYLSSEANLKSTKNDSIYFLWIGVNDITDLFEKYPEDSSERRQILDDVIYTIKSDIELLYKAGARYIMFLGLIPLEILPMYHSYSTEVRAELASLIQDYNTRLERMITSIRTQYSDSNVYFFDTNTAFKTIFTTEEIQSNSVAHCQSGDNCGDYIWWDILHPSSKTHLRIAELVYKEIETLKW